MPHLTSTRAGTASTDVRTGFGIPGYAHPLVAPAEWAELTRPGTPLHWVVLNVADGPGARPDPHCLEAAGRLRNAGVRVLGHLDTAYGARAFGEVISERAPLHRLVPGRRLPPGPLPERTRRARPRSAAPSARCRAIRDGAHIVLGHGTHPYPGYAESADQLVTFSRPLERLPLVAGGRVDRRPSARALLPLRPRGAPPASGGGAAHRPLAGRLDHLLHRSHRPWWPQRPLGDHARLLGRNRLADRNGCLGMKKAMAVLRGEQL